MILLRTREDQAPLGARAADAAVTNAAVGCLILSQRIPGVGFVIASTFLDNDSRLLSPTNACSPTSSVKNLQLNRDGVATRVGKAVRVRLRRVRGTSGEHRGDGHLMGCPITVYLPHHTACPSSPGPSLPTPLTVLTLSRAGPIPSNRPVPTLGGKRPWGFTLDHSATFGASRSGTRSMVVGMATKKVTITIDENQLERIRALVKAGTTSSVSGFVQHAVAVALDDIAGWGAMLADALTDTGGELSREERRWADEVLGVKGRAKSPAA